VDSALNYYRRPTAAGDCHMVGEGVDGATGQAFDSDTAVATFTPGPVASWTVPAAAWLHTGGTLNLAQLVSGAKDANGNAVSAPQIAASATGQGFTLTGLSLAASAEAQGTVTLTAGTATATLTVHAVANLNAHDWRLSWACFDRPGPPLFELDSATYVLTADSVEYVGATEEGVRILLHGAPVYTDYLTGGREPRVNTQRITEPARQFPGGTVRMGGGATGERTTDAVLQPSGDYLGGNFCAPGPPAFAGFRALTLARVGT
jgi:hypothetical protein